MCLSDKTVLAGKRRALQCTSGLGTFAALSLNAPSDRFAGRSRVGLRDLPSPPARNHGRPLWPFDHQSGASELPDTYDKEDFGSSLDPFNQRRSSSWNQTMGFRAPSTTTAVSAAACHDGLSRGNRRATGTRLRFSRGSDCRRRKAPPWLLSPRRSANWGGRRPSHERHAAEHRERPG